MADLLSGRWREALAEIISRRSLLGAPLLGASGLLALDHAEAGKKKKKRKKRCKKGASRCGKGCCKAPSVCSASSCFCTGSEGNCKPIAQELIDLIADALGVPPEEIGANPDQPLAQCATIPPLKKDEISALIGQQFGVTGAVPWCDGIKAGADGILLEITTKV